jgi:AcrR family transcriptional regulator
MSGRRRSEKVLREKVPREPSEHVRQKQDRRRNDILDAAAAVFAERGYFNTSMKDIAERLGMQPGSLYHYYPSKEAALEEMCRLSAVEFCESLRATLARGGSAIAMVREGMLAHLTSDRRAYVEIFAFSRRNLPPGIVDDLNNLARAYRQIWKRIFQHGAERGEWREGLDPDIAADAVLALCNSAAATLSRRKSADPRKAAPMWVAIFLDGTRRRES